jgi:uncharacterized protein (TIRG00374 family)
VVPFAAKGASTDTFTDAVSQFFDALGLVHWRYMTLALVAFTIYLTIRSRALWNILRAAYPDREIQWRRIWGAYFAGYGINSILPAGAGNIAEWFLLRSSVEGSSFATVASGTFVELGFDFVQAALVLTFAFTQEVFTKPNEFQQLNAFDLSWVATHIQLVLLIIGGLVAASVALYPMTARRLRRVWLRLRQGATVLRQPRRYLSRVFALQALAWCFRFLAFWLLLEAFGIQPSPGRVLIVIAALIISAGLPVTPGGAGVQQALLVVVFSGAASDAAVAAYSVGQEIAITGLTLVIGLVALVTIFDMRSFRQVIRESRRAHAAERALESAAETSEVPS